MHDEPARREPAHPFPAGPVGTPSPAGPAGFQEDAMTGSAGVAEDRPRAGRLADALPQRRALIRLVLAQQLTGVVLGLIWLLWAPTSVSYLLDTGNGSGVVIPAQSEAQVAADGRYAVLTALAGLVFGLLSWRLRRNRGPVALAVLVASSLLGSLLALATGQLLGGDQHADGLNTAFHPGLVLHGSAEVFLQALFAALVYTVFVGLTGDRNLGRAPAVTDGPRPTEAAQPDDDPLRQPDEELHPGG
jgi:hypothetical protein